MLCFFDSFSFLVSFLSHSSYIFVTQSSSSIFEINVSIMPKGFLNLLMRTTGSISANFFSFKSAFRTTMPKPLFPPFETTPHHIFCSCCFLFSFSPSNPILLCSTHILHPLIPSVQRNMQMQDTRSNIN